MLIVCIPLEPGVHLARWSCQWWLLEAGEGQVGDRRLQRRHQPAVAAARGDAHWRPSLTAAMGLGAEAAAIWCQRLTAARGWAVQGVGG